MPRRELNENKGTLAGTTMKNRDSERSRKSVLAIALLLLLLMFGGIFAARSINTDRTSRRPMRYPAQWANCGLPFFPGAELVEVNSPNQFELITPMSGSQARDFLESQFSERSWDSVEPTNPRGPHDSEFFNEENEVFVTISPVSGSNERSRVKITIRPYNSVADNNVPADYSGTSVMIAD